MMHLGWVPKGPLTSFFVANSNGDDMTFATLHFVQLYRQPALLTKVDYAALPPALRPGTVCGRLNGEVLRREHDARTTRLLPSPDNL